MLCVKSRLVGHPQKNRMSLLILFTMPVPLIHLIVTVSSRKGWMYPIPGFLLRRLSVLTVRSIWRQHVGACSHLSPLTAISLTLFPRGLVKVAGASSFGKAENATAESSHDPLKMQRVSSDSTTTSQEQKKGKFRLRKWLFLLPPFITSRNFVIFAPNSQTWRSCKNKINFYIKTRKFAWF